MNALSFTNQSTAYTLSPELSQPASIETVRRPSSDELPREDALLQKLGARGWGRIIYFRNYYEPDWGGSGRALSPKALDALSRFVADAQFPVAASFPSVFLTDKGGLELVWESATGKSVQVEFTGSGAEFYEQATEDEGAVAFADLTWLARKLAS